jgi:hypothetical protein
MATKETPLEFLQNLRREYRLSESGLYAIIRSIDEFMKAAEEHPECLIEHPEYIDDRLSHRKSLMESAACYKAEIELLEQEIERERQSPNPAPMIYRLVTLFGHG